MTEKFSKEHVEVEERCSYTTSWFLAGWHVISKFQQSIPHEDRRKISIV